MLKKLIKHEFKSSWLEMVIANGAVLIITVFVAILIRIGSSILFQTMGLTSLLLLYVGQIILVFMTIIRSLNKKLFTNEGYLSFTLPVTTRQLLFSKVFVNVIWIIGTALVMIISLVIMGAITIGGADIGLDFIYFDISEFASANILPLLVLLFSFFISSILFLITILGVLTIVNTGKMKKKKLLIGVILYYILTNVLSWIEQFVIIIPFTLYYIGGTWTIARSTTLYSLFTGIMGPEGLPIINFNSMFLEIVFIIGIFIFSEKMISKHLELE
ncbi:MAG: hypothetical protein WCT17_05900 [Bacilli bacterium]